MRLRPTAVLLLLLGFSPGLVYGLALGEIELNSGLNEPLNAEIVVLSAAPEELANLSAKIAPRETFERYGLGRPDFLSGLVFTVERSGGRDILRVVSRQPIPEPFVTFLVEAQWRRGRLLREYTVLLDPPVFMPAPDTAMRVPAPIAAPRGVRSQSSATTGTVVRTEPRAPSSRPARPISTAAPVFGSDYGPIQRNETLWAIAQQLRTDRSITMNQMMVAIYQANQNAFLGNINLMKEGSVLRIPQRSTIVALSQQQAFATAVAHNQAWRSGTPAQVARVTSSPSAVTPSQPEPPRLKLVEPDIAVSGSNAASGAGLANLAAARESLARNEADISRLSGENEQLRADLAEIRRLISLKDSELAQLQQRLSTTGPALTPVPTDVAAEMPGTMPDTATLPAVAGTDAGTSTTATPDTSVPTTTASTPAATTPDATPDTATPVTASTPEAQPVTKTESPVATTSLPAEPGFIARLFGGIKSLFSSLFFWILLGAAILVGFALVVLKGRRDSETDPLDALVREDAKDETSVVPALKVPDAKGATAGTDVEFFDDSGTFKPVDFAAAQAQESTTSEYPFEDTIGAGGELKLDQSDPLAEADFHMAYGLYDQAADLVKKAVARESDRVDLRMKLLEIFFVWGNQEEFRATAQDMHDNLSEQVAGEWDKIAIMGKQICPEDELFAGETGMGSGAEIDLEFDTGESTAHAVDFEAFGDDDSVGADLDLDIGGADLDLDIGGALGDTDVPALADAKEAAPVADDDELDFDLGLDFSQSISDTGTQPVPEDSIKDQITARLNSTESDETAEMDLSDLGVDLDLGMTAGDDSDALSDVFDDADKPASATDETSQLRTPTTEMTAAQGLDLDIGGVFGDLDSGDEDETARDLAALEDSMSMTGPNAVVSEDEDTGHFSAEIETLHGDALDVDISAFSDAELDDTLFIAGSDEPTGAHTEDAFSAAVFGGDDADNTKMIGPDDQIDASGDDAFSAAIFSGSEDDTVLVEAGSQSDGLATDVFGLDNTSQNTAQNLDLDIGDSLGDGREDRTTVKVATADLALPDGDDELSEVGTKLDLARAYMDMGDPDGARGILEEVLAEGNDVQQADARQLLEVLG